MIGGDLVEHHSKLLRRAAATALLNEPFEEGLSRAVSDLGAAAGRLDRADAAALLGRVVANLRDDGRSATVPPTSGRAGDRVRDPLKRVKALVEAVKRIEPLLRAVWAW